MKTDKEFSFQPYEVFMKAHMQLVSGQMVRELKLPRCCLAVILAAHYLMDRRGVTSITIEDLATQSTLDEQTIRRSMEALIKAQLAQAEKKEGAQVVYRFDGLYEYLGVKHDAQQPVYTTIDAIQQQLEQPAYQHVMDLANPMGLTTPILAALLVGRPLPSPVRLHLLFASVNEPLPFHLTVRALLSALYGSPSELVEAGQ